MNKQHWMKNGLLGLMSFAVMTVTVHANAKGMDADKNGEVSKAEVTAHRQKMLDKRFSKLDTNQDGQLTQDELKGKRGVAKKADANSDGVVTKQEANAHMQQGVDKYMSKKDANGDGKLDESERKKSTKDAKVKKDPARAKSQKAKKTTE